MAPLKYPNISPITVDVKLTNVQCPQCLSYNYHEKLLLLFRVGSRLLGRDYSGLYSGDGTRSTSFCTGLSRYRMGPDLLPLLSRQASARATWTLRTWPSVLGYTVATRAGCHSFRGRLVSLIITTSPTRRFRRGRVHFCRS